MLRTILLAMVTLAACDSSSSSSSGGTGGGGGVLDKLKGAGEKVGGALDKLDTDEVKEKLAAAKTSIGNGLEAAEECAWAARVAGDTINEAMKNGLDELRKLCSFDAPLGKATAAVVRAEKAKAEQPGAPSFTECSSDDYAKAKATLDSSPHAGEQRWKDLQARWTKVCP